MSTDYKASKKKLPKKEVRLLKRKSIIVFGVAAIVAITGILGGIYFLKEAEKKQESTLLIGLDWFVDSFDTLCDPLPNLINKIIWDQIAEGLFTYNGSNENAPIIPNLAKDMGTWSPDGLNFTCLLREGIFFHDGAPFNATAVKWNFDRIYRFIDTMPWKDIKYWSYLFQSNGNPIINKTIVINNYTIRLVLNEPYAPLKSLLGCWPSYILSPHSTPENNFIDKFTGKLIGTGPFILESYWMHPTYELCGNITISANKDYWGGKPLVEKVDFLYFNETEAMEKMLSGELSYTWWSWRWSDNVSILNIYRNASGINVVPKTFAAGFYLSMNNDLIPLEMRKAISYAFNYSDYIKLATDDLGVRWKSPLSKGMLYSNWDLNVAVYDIQVARQTLIDASWPGTTNLTATDDISHGNEWEKLVDDGTPLETYNYSIINGRSIHIFSSSLVTKYLKQIGVKIELINLTAEDYDNKMNSGELEFFFSGWGPSFNDPIEMLNPLYSINPAFNICNFSDTQVQGWLEQGLIETNDTIREQVYYNIQKRLVEELYPVVWIYCPVRYHILASNLKGTPIEGDTFKVTLKDAYFI